MATVDPTPPGTPPSEPPITEGLPIHVVTIGVGEKVVEPAPEPAAAEPAPAAPPSAPPGADEAVQQQSSWVSPDGQARAKPARSAPASILTVDIGGTKVKILATGQTEARKAPSGKGFTPAKLIETVRSLAHDWEYEAISIGYPGLVGPNGPRSEPGNL